MGQTKAVPENWVVARANITVLEASTLYNSLRLWHLNIHQRGTYKQRTASDYQLHVKWNAPALPSPAALCLLPTLLCDHLETGIQGLKQALVKTETPCMLASPVPYLQEWLAHEQHLYTSIIHEQMRT